MFAPSFPNIATLAMVRMKQSEKRASAWIPNRAARYRTGRPRHRARRFKEERAVERIHSRDPDEQMPPVKFKTVKPRRNRPADPLGGANGKVIGRLFPPSVEHFRRSKTKNGHATPSIILSWRLEKGGFETQPRSGQSRFSAPRNPGFDRITPTIEEVDHFR